MAHSFAGDNTGDEVVLLDSVGSGSFVVILSVGVSNASASNVNVDFFQESGGGVQFLTLSVPPHSSAQRSYIGWSGEEAGGVFFASNEANQIAVDLEYQIMSNA